MVTSLAMINSTYVVSLEESVDRKEHIRQEFARVGITNYEFFNATPADDNEVKELFKDGVPGQFPPCCICGGSAKGTSKARKLKSRILKKLDKNPIEVINKFRGTNLKWGTLGREEKVKAIKKNIDALLAKKGFASGGCNCSRDHLYPTEIANILSFQKLLKLVALNKNDGLTMICEDDVQFTDSGYENIKLMVSKSNLEKNSLDLNKPLLIQVSRAYDPKFHDPRTVVKFDLQRFHSNPCFIVNHLYAEIYFKHFKEFDLISDLYMHFALPTLDKTIQCRSILPLPAYECSTGVNKKFSSTIAVEFDRPVLDSLVGRPLVDND